jgi:hypothetical protein
MLSRDSGALNRLFTLLWLSDASDANRYHRKFKNGTHKVTDRFTVSFDFRSRGVRILVHFVEIFSSSNSAQLLSHRDPSQRNAGDDSNQSPCRRQTEVQCPSMDVRPLGDGPLQVPSDEGWSQDPCARRTNPEPAIYRRRASQGWKKSAFRVQWMCSFCQTQFGLRLAALVSPIS